MSETVKSMIEAVEPLPSDQPATLGLRPAPLRHDAPADRFMRRLLRLPVDAPRASAAAARKAFRTSLLVTTVRCLLMYILLPFVLPAIGIATDAAPVIVLPINVLAIAMIVMSIRRFWRADHGKRWWYTALGTAVIAFLVYAIVSDILQLR